MGLFRQQALEQRRLPDPVFTSVAIAALKHWLWIAALGSLLVMAGVWLLFAKTYTLYDTSATINGMQTILLLSPDIKISADAAQPTRVIAHCPQAVEGSITEEPPQTYLLHLDQPVHADCQITLILHEERLFERFFR